MWRMREHYRHRRINTHRLCDIRGRDERTARHHSGAGLFSCPETKGHTITGTWRTSWRCNTYRLAENGQLQKEKPMSNTHIQNMQTDRHRDATRAVHDELLQLVARRAEQHTKEKR